MKFPKEKNKIFFYTALLLTAGLFAFILPKSKSIAGIWHYTKVTKNGKVLFPTGPDDTMVLETTGRFRYDIAAVSKHMYGNWELRAVPVDSTPLKIALQLHYLPSNTTRTFLLIYLKKRDSMAIREGNTIFEYRYR